MEKRFAEFTITELERSLERMRKEKMFFAGTGKTLRKTGKAVLLTGKDSQ